MLKDYLYDCPCQNSCWKAFLFQCKKFYHPYGDPDADYDLCVAEVSANIQPLHLSEMTSETVTGRILCQDQYL